MNKWIAEFELEDGDTMPEHMDLEYKGTRIDFHCKPLEQEPTTKNDLGVDCISRQATINAVKRIHPVDTDYDCTLYDKVDVMYVLDEMPSVTPQEPVLDKIRAEIEQLRNFRAENYDLEQYCDCFDARIIFRDDVLKIIDKYKAEQVQDRK